MKWSLFAYTWKSLRTENLLFRTLIPVLIISNLISMAGWLSKDRVTVLIPPTLNEAVSVSRRNADAGFKKSWGLYAASLLGNVSPGNADFVLEALQLVMSPRVFGTLKQSIAADVEMIKKDGVSTSFEQKQVMYEKETDKVFVIGRTGISNAAGSVTKFDRIFEVRVTIDNGQPQIVELDSYQGKPRTQEVVQQMAQIAASKPGEVEQ